MNTKILTRAALIGSLSAVVLAFSVVAAERPSKRPATQVFMRQKLVWSQAVLEGLSLEKFDLVAKNAVKMRNMTQSNLWLTIRHPTYMTLTTNYYKSVDALYMAAADRNLEEATEAYMKVTRNCVECHRLIRAEQRNNP